MLFLTILFCLASSSTVYYLSDSLGNLTLSNNLIGDEISVHIELSNIESNITQLELAIIDYLNNTVASLTTSNQNSKLTLPGARGHCYTAFGVAFKLSLMQNGTVIESSRGEQYELNNCLVSEDGRVPKSTHGKHYSPLYWYLQCLNSTIPKSGALCGEAFCTHLYRSDLYLSRCDEENTHVMTPWYQMAIQLIAYRLSCGTDAGRDAWSLVGIELLERHCAAKDSGLSDDELSAPESFFNTFIAHFEKIIPQTSLEYCEPIRHQFDVRYNDTMSKLLYNQWYYRAFKFTLLPGQDMELRAITLISCVAVLPVILLAFIVYCVYKIRTPKNKPCRSV